MSFEPVPFPEPVHVVPGQVYLVGIDPETGMPFCRPTDGDGIVFSHSGVLTGLRPWTFGASTTMVVTLPHWADLLSPAEQAHEQEERDCC